MNERTYRADVPDQDVTPPELFFDRRRFLRTAAVTGGVGAMGGAGLLLGSTGCAESASHAGSGPNRPEIVPPRQWPDGFKLPEGSAYKIPDGVDATLTPREVAGSHNNFYEFLPGKAGDFRDKTGPFVIDPWELRISGECNRPQTITLADIDAIEHEQRLYHFRCVERWAMNVPWAGFPLSRLLERVQPTAKARYVRFVSASRPEQMPGIKQSGSFPWPYHEGLRLDEAMHDLTFVVTGAYGEPLPKQHGAPLRIHVPWKYGYKSAKSLVEIELLAEQPPTFWSTAAPHEYGFLSNVNPNIPHPRWSQARSYWVRNREWFPTPIFNGYDAYVRELYPDEPRTMQEVLGPGQSAR